MIQAAYRVLERNRLGSVSVNDILLDAGLSTRAFYRHFRSKDELLLAMFDAESERMASDVARRVEQADGARSALSTWISVNLAVSFDQKRFHRAQVMLSPEVVRASGYAIAQVRTHQLQRVTLRRILEAGARDGSFRHTDPALDAITIQDVVSLIVSRRYEGVEELDWGAALAHLHDFVGRAIGVTPPWA